MRIYRDQLGDEAGYLKERMAKLKYGMDYYDLIIFHNQKGEKEKAVEVAEEGIAKGAGRTINLIVFLKTYYQEKERRRVSL